MNPRPLIPTKVLLSDAVALLEPEAMAAYSKKQSHRENFLLRYVIEQELYEK